MIPISSPLMGSEEQDAVSRVMQSGVLAQGPRVAEFERAFADFIGVRHAIATSNGTTALHTALLAHGIGPGDEVITTPFTFIASTNAVLYVGAMPVFVDVDDSFNVDADLLEAALTERTRAVLPVHLYGQPAAMDTICRFANRHNLAVVEDACQAHGAEFAGRKVGSFGTGCFSFYPTKNMTTGEGGMITTDDGDIAERARWIINHGSQRRYHHEFLGYNYRMTEIAAAIGLEQLKKLPGFNARRIANAEFYDRSLAHLPGLLTPSIYPSRSHVYHQYTIRLTRLGRDEMAEALSKSGIGTGIYYPVPVHRQRSVQYLGLGGLALPVAERLSGEVLSIPVHPGITDAERTLVADAIVRLCACTS
ncbi:MAG: DegT/DnrJ/EryC1/StrS family aminotransferase [Chloroflexi bacterium]|nr:DegT/DnrJ/EryC1/StrS family aminotransferase [Chloroflexota bacterium]